MQILHLCVFLRIFLIQIAWAKKEGVIFPFFRSVRFFSTTGYHWQAV